jgi:HEAT repeat protein
MADISELAVKAKNTNLPTYARRDAIEALGRGGDLEGMRTLATLMEDPDRYLRRDVIKAIARFGEHAVDVLIEALQDGDELVRRDVVNALARVGNGRAAEPLRALLRDSSYAVRSATEGALRRLEAPAPDVPAEPELEAAVEEDRAEPAHEPIDDFQTREFERLSMPGPPPPPPPDPTPDLPPVPVATTRIDLFFVERAEAVKALFAALHRGTTDLPELQRRRDEAQAKLNFERADKDDDLDAVSRETAGVESRLARNKQALQEAENDDAELDAKVEYGPVKLLHAIWAPARDKVEEQRQRIANRIERLKTAINDEENELAALREKNTQIANPIKALKAELAAVAEEHDALTSELRKADERINTHIVDTIRYTAPDILSTRLDAIAAIANASEFFFTCVDGLRSTLRELDRLANRWEAAQIALESARGDAESATGKVGERFAAGFSMVSNTRRADVALSGSLTVKEDHSFFGGYSGADGHASGEGTAQIEYTVEELAWRAPEALDSSVADFANSWLRLGECTAEAQAIEAQRFAAEQSMRDFVHFIRRQIELDFRSGS